MKALSRRKSTWQVKEIQKNVNEVNKEESIDAILSKSGLNNPEVIVFYSSL